MKIDRLIGILSILLQQDKVTAPYLAEKFEVSRRTINRDIEDLCRAGIPVSTSQGQKGGISIMEGYRMERALFTSADMQEILAGLRSLDSVCGTKRYQQLMEKLSAGASEKIPERDYVRIDLASWYKSSLAPKLELIRGAVESTELIRFYYYGPKGDGERLIEPYLLVYQWASWYVWGYCMERREFRLFKLNRMKNLKNTGQTFEKRPVEEPDFSAEKVFPAVLEVKARFASAAKWRLIEEYGGDSFRELGDGTLLFTHAFTNRENLVSWVLSFGTEVEILEPEEIRQEIRETAAGMTKIYSENKIMMTDSCRVCCASMILSKEKGEMRMIESRCGSLCSECGCKEEVGCRGCLQIEKPFWGEFCPVKKCCEDRGLTYCGQCSEFPCDLAVKFAYDEKEGDHGKRLDQCRCWNAKRN